MAKNTATYDGYEFDLNQFPFNGPVTGGDIKDEIGKKTGQSPDGAVAKVSPDGRYEVIGGDCWLAEYAVGKGPYFSQTLD